MYGLSSGYVWRSSISWPSDFIPHGFQHPGTKTQWMPRHYLWLKKPTKTDTKVACSTGSHYINKTHITDKVKNLQQGPLDPADRLRATTCCLHRPLLDLAYLCDGHCVPTLAEKGAECCLNWNCVACDGLAPSLAAHCLESASDLEQERKPWHTNERPVTCDSRFQAVPPIPKRRWLWKRSLSACRSWTLCLLLAGAFAAWNVSACQEWSRSCFHGSKNLALISQAKKQKQNPPLYSSILYKKQHWIYLQVEPKELQRSKRNGITLGRED